MERSCSCWLIYPERIKKKYELSEATYLGRLWIRKQKDTLLQEPTKDDAVDGLKKAEV